MVRRTDTRRDFLIELVSACLLALATMGTAWSSYQSNSWGGAQANAFASANSARSASVREATIAGQLAQADLAALIEWLNAAANGERERQAFYEQRFRDEFRLAFDVWLATDPLSNPDAPATPFLMAEYELAAAQRSEELSDRADTFTAEARGANQTSNQYVLFAVLFASVLFFAGICTKFPTVRLRIAVLGIGVTLFLLSIAWLATMPVRVSISI
jgi:hypothetical protein